VIAPLLWGAALGVIWLLDRRRDSMEAALTQQLQQRLPPHLARWSSELAAAAVAHCPSAVTLLDWALLHAGLIDRESGGGDQLQPRGPAGTGDHASRWFSVVPPFANELGLLTGEKRKNAKGVTEYEVRPPAWGGATVPGWGYGLGQHDFVSNRVWLAGAGWKDARANLLKSAQLLRTLWNRFGELRTSVVAYNCGPTAAARAAAEGLPDKYTTGRDYSADVIARATSWGFGGST
jgi:hypothetical protein